MYKKILVPLDGSELAERALKPAFTLVEAFGGELVLLRVPVGVQYVVMPVGSGVMVPDEVLESDREDSEAYLQAIQTQWVGSKVQVHAHSVAGVPADVILETAQNEHVDLIVMSTHGRTGLSRLLYGSVAESVLRGAHIPILLLPMRD